MQFELGLDKKDVINWVISERKSIIPIIKNKKLHVIDLFSGCGGMTLGLEKASQEFGIDLNVKLAIDQNIDAIRTYEDNFGQYLDKIVHGDILSLFKYSSSRTLTKVERGIKQSLGDVDILVAGPPCQGHSDLNNHSRRNDPRNELYLSTIRAVYVTRPKFVIIENVPTVVHSSENVVNIAKSELKDLGYYYKELIIDFLKLGIPQSRKRHVIIASPYKEFIENQNIPTNSQFEKPVLGDFLSDCRLPKTNSLLDRASILSEVNKMRINYLYDNNLYDLPNELRPNCHKDMNHSYKSSYGRLCFSQPAQTLTSGFGSMGQGRYVHPIKRRTITAREAARIQGFPDSFSWNVSTLTALRKLIANAVPPQMTYKFGAFYISYFHSTDPDKSQRPKTRRDHVHAS